MARPRSIPDTQVYAAIRGLAAELGEKAVTFGSVARASGLAAPSLAQRYGSRDRMLRAALLDGWDVLDAAVADADAAKSGSAGFLKAIAPDERALGAELTVLMGGLRDAELRDRAARWRDRVIVALAGRLGKTGRPDLAAASALFAAWQGRVLWAACGKPGFKLKPLAASLKKT